MLQELRVQTTRLERVEMAAFCGLDQLLELDLANNKLSSAPHLCPLKCSHETLDLARNRISKISKNYLKGFKKLRVIILEQNNIIQLPYLHWVQHSLSEIKASHNYLTSLEAFKTFGIFKHLSSIHLGENNICRLNVTLLRHMPKLTYLELHSNNITHVDDFRSFYDRDINLAENPWHCGVALSWMGDEDMEFESMLVCATPVCRRNMAIAKMSKLRKPRTLPEPRTNLFMCSAREIRRYLVMLSLIGWAHAQNVPWGHNCLRQNKFETKWPKLCWLNLQIHLFVRQMLYFGTHLTDIHSQQSNKQYNFL